MLRHASLASGLDSSGSSALASASPAERQATDSLCGSVSRITTPSRLFVLPLCQFWLGVLQPWQPTLQRPQRKRHTVSCQQADTASVEVGPSSSSISRSTGNWPESETQPGQPLRATSARSLDLDVVHRVCTICLPGHGDGAQNKHLTERLIQQHIQVPLQTRRLRRRLRAGRTSPSSSGCGFEIFVKIYASAGCEDVRSVDFRCHHCKLPQSRNIRRAMQVAWAALAAVLTSRPFNSATVPKTLADPTQVC